MNCFAELPEGERLRAHVYASLGDALDRAEGNVAEEAAYYEKALEIVPNLYSLKNLATLYFRYPELNKPKELCFELWEKAWHAGVWSAANFLGYNYQEEDGRICLRRLNGWKRACFIVNPTVRMNWH